MRAYFLVILTGSNSKSKKELKVSQKTCIYPGSIHAKGKSTHWAERGCASARNPRGSTQLPGCPNLALSKWTPKNHSRHRGIHSAIWLTHSIWAQEKSISQIPLLYPHLPQPHVQTIWTVHKAEDNFRGFPRAWLDAFQSFLSGLWNQMHYFFIHEKKWNHFLFEYRFSSLSLFFTFLSSFRHISILSLHLLGSIIIFFFYFCSQSSSLNSLWCVLFS